MANSPFKDEWRACLRAHYAEVVRSGDFYTEKSLRRILVKDARIPEDEVDELFITETSRTDGSGDNG